MCRALRAAVILTAFTAAVALPARPAFAQANDPPLRAWSDALDLPVPGAAAQMLEREYAARYAPPAAGGGASAADAAAGRAMQLKNIDTVIAGLEQRLASLKADDPQRASILSQIATFKGARAQVAAQPAPAAAAPRPAAPPRPTGPVTLAQALASTRALVETGTGRQAFAKLLAGPAGKDPRQAEALAAAAVLQDKPVGALAALLAARAVEPKNPAHLVNAAGLLSLLGRPAEAIALLDGADALKVPFPAVIGLDGQAVALNNRGHALLALGRAKDAEAALRKAVALEPLLAEARTNLAMALRAQDKKDEAVRFFRAGMRRAPTPTAAPPSGSPSSGTGSSGPAQTPGAPQAGADPFSPEGGARRPAEQVYDLSKGVRGSAPGIRYAQTPQDAEALSPKIEAMLAEIRDREQSYPGRLSALLAKRRLPPDPEGALSRARLVGIHDRLRFPHREPSLRKLWADMEEAFKSNFGEVVFNGGSRFVPNSGGADVAPKSNPATASGRFAIESRRIMDEEGKESSACAPGDSACQRAVKAKYDKQRCGAAGEALNDWRRAMVRLDNATAAYVAESYKLMTGLAANISDPVEHELAALEIERYTDGILRFRLLEPAYSLRYSVMFSFGRLCEAKGSAEEPRQAVLPRAAVCLLGGASYSVDLFVASFSFDCEKVAIEVEKGFLILEGFVEVEYVIEGEGAGNVTVGVGVKGGVDGPAGTGVGVKGGCFVTVDTGTGSLVDVGVRGGVSAGAGPVSVEAGGSFGIIAG